MDMILQLTVTALRGFRLRLNWHVSSLCKYLEVAGHSRLTKWGVNKTSRSKDNSRRHSPSWVCNYFQKTPLSYKNRTHDKSQAWPLREFYRMRHRAALCLAEHIFFSNLRRILKNIEPFDSDRLLVTVAKSKVCHKPRRRYYLSTKLQSYLCQNC